MATAEIRGKKIYYKEYGSGTPLLLIAGLGSDSTSWLPVIIGLSKNFRVITFDNVGVGRSSPDNDGITIQEMAQETASLIKFLSIEKTNVLGHSMGGMIAMELAITNPDLVDKLIIAASCTKINTRNKALFQDMVAYLEEGMDKRLWFRNLFYWIFSPKFFEDKEILDQAVQMAINYRYPQSDASFKNQVKAITNFDCSNRVKKIHAPTLIMSGNEDLLFPKSDNQFLFDIPSATEIDVEHAAHSIHMDESQVFMDNVVKFLSPRQGSKP